MTKKINMVSTELALLRRQIWNGTLQSEIRSGSPGFYGIPDIA